MRLWVWQNRRLHLNLPAIFFMTWFIRTSMNVGIDAIRKIQAMGNFASSWVYKTQFLHKSCLKEKERERMNGERTCRLK